MLNYFSYFSEIEETFVRRRGKNLLLSPLDWALIEAWKERGVPLHVVLRAIENVFDGFEKQPARQRSIKSLVYCRDEVENLFAVWLDAQVGNHPAQQATQQSETNNPPTDKPEFEIPAEIIISHLQKTFENLNQTRSSLNGSWQQFREEIAAQLNALQDDFVNSQNVESLEVKLSALDHRLDKLLPNILATDEFAKIKTETVAQLRSYKTRMNTEIYTETFKNLLIKNLRDSLDLPRFSLFYL